MKFLLQPPVYKFFEPRGQRPNQTQNCPVKVIHGQTFSLPLIVLKNVCMIKCKFPHHSLSYVRNERTKLPQDATEYMQFFQPPPLIVTPCLFTLKLFSDPSPAYCHPLLLRTGEYPLHLITSHFDHHITHP